MNAADLSADLTAYSDEDLAALWRVSKQTIRRLVGRGELGSFYVGQQLRIPHRSALDFQVRHQGQVLDAPDAQVFELHPLPDTA